MGAQRFHISDTNPNNGIGGGGCACSELVNPDQAGPFVIFPGTMMDNNLSPHNVVCIGCLCGAVDKAYHDTNEILSAGEDDEPNVDEDDLIL